MLPNRRQIIGGALALAATPALAAPRSRLIAGPWQDFGSVAEVDDAPWAAFLDRYRVMGGNGVALIRYGAAKAAGDRPAGYLEALQKVDPTRLSLPAAFAFWSNLYNALTVDLVIEAWPVSSIKEVRGGLFNTGPWTDKLVTVAGRELSLDDIEHGILRPVWGDNRVHYAVNCAAIGCPNLASRPFAAATLERMLNAGARAYVNDQRGATVTGDGLVVSSIYDWFEEDFGGTEAGVIAHLRQHAEPDLAARLDGIREVEDDRYDWSINAA